MTTQISDVQSIDLVLIGMPGAPLVIHSFSEKAKGEIRDKQAKKGKTAKEVRDTAGEVEAAKYFDQEGRECAPVTAIKKSFVTAATAMDNLTKVALRQAIFVSPTLDRSSHLVPIESPDGAFITGVGREDAVTIGINTRGLAYRPEYRQWRLRVTVDFNTRLISQDQLLMLARQAGWGVGICEGRPEKTSALGWGRFTVELAA